MGGASATSAAISSQNGVVSRMLDNLNVLHGPPVKATGNADQDAQILRERLLAFNKARFFDEFSYHYRKNQSRPEYCENQAEVIGKDGFASFPIEEVNQVRYYVENRILGGSSLSREDKDQFKDDVVEMVESLIMSDHKGWQSDEFVRTYGKLNSSGGMSKLRVEGMIIWDVIDAPDPSGANPSSQRLMVLNYVGVGYPRK
ncbi:hypothetical protein B0I35DRAFT_423869 [Stachybotrys elegans]|uniref:Uncharacterized protein n=1 Tax=Stachybotrys elegans TaxID=80388 RepID=A0A8K0WTI9_9HYPO|nr:hypothetical protein B0I35DRAFT_423869 [Stachybotrys elegans]